MEDLILHAHILYEHETGPSSPPLPPTPMGEPVPQISYGSKMTKVATVFPEAPAPPSPGQDFTPRLPARPNNSIHPSSRATPASPTKLRHPEKPLPLTVQELPIDDSPGSTPTKASSFAESIDRNSITFPGQDNPTAEPVLANDQKLTDDSHFGGSVLDTSSTK